MLDYFRTSSSDQAYQAVYFTRFFPGGRSMKRSKTSGSEKNLGYNAIRVCLLLDTHLLSLGFTT